MLHDALPQSLWPPKGDASLSLLLTPLISSPPSSSSYRPSASTTGDRIVRPSSSSLTNPRKLFFYSKFSENSLTIAIIRFSLFYAVPSYPIQMMCLTASMHWKRAGEQKINRNRYFELPRLSTTNFGGQRWHQNVLLSPGVGCCCRCVLMMCCRGTGWLRRLRVNESGLLLSLSIQIEGDFFTHSNTLLLSLLLHRPLFGKTITPQPGNECIVAWMTFTI